MIIINMDLLFEIEEITKKQYKSNKVDDEDKYVGIENVRQVILDLVEAYNRKEK